MRRPGLLFVHPHPDDESIACGGAIARAVADGSAVTLVTCTGGEAGENIAGIDLGDEDLPTHRRREMAAALDALGVTDHVWLGYRDSGMAGTEDNEHPDSLHRADLDEAAGRLASIIRRARPAVVVSDDEQGTYGHPDHIKASAVTRRAVELAGDPDWSDPEGREAWMVAKRYHHAIRRSRVMRVHRRLMSEGLASPFGDDPDADLEAMPFGVDDDAVTTVVDISEHLETKQAAIASHASQIGEDSFFLNLPDDLAVDLFGTETYVLVDGEPGGDPERDLLAGLDGVREES